MTTTTTTAADFARALELLLQGKPLPDVAKALAPNEPAAGLAALVRLALPAADGSSPGLIAALRALADLEDARHALTLAQRRDHAAQTLADIADNAEPPETRRKAAADLLKAGRSPATRPERAPPAPPASTPRRAPAPRDHPPPPEPDPLPEEAALIDAVRAALAGPPIRDGGPP